ncbi:MAG: hypothetical protein R3325_09290 [Thermoanaerobaculia bacterium]|nr:hypothetical protein [Thermoanaerobaculia bacterium]
MSDRRRCLAGALVAAVSATSAAAASLEVRLVDGRGQPVDGAVVVARGVGAPPPPPAEMAVMDQVEEQFVPELLTVPVGTTVNFPNRDDIRHHVYSFSEAKQFELPLYKGEPAEPVRFEKPGPVVLGCNIHDHMRGYIFVAGSPHYAVSGEDGRVELGDLPPGDYEVEAWHPRQKGESARGTAVVADGGAAGLDLELDLKPALRLRRGGARGRKY